MSQPHIIEWRSLPAKPWKNGAGVTRDIAVEPLGATPDDFEWRISVADVAHDAPFSAFPGVDRCIVLLEGVGMRLRADDGSFDARLDTPLQPFRFAGDTAATATLINGPCVDFNVMVRRGSWLAQVKQALGTAQLASASAGLLMCVQGSVSIGSPGQPELPLTAGQSALWRWAAPARTLRSNHSSSRVLIVQLHALDQEAAP